SGGSPSTASPGTSHATRASPSFKGPLPPLSSSCCGSTSRPLSSCTALNSLLRTLVSVVIDRSRCLRLRRRACEGWWQPQIFTCRPGPFGPGRSALASVAFAAFTIVSVPQEIEIGREENAQVRQQMTQLRDAQVSAYITRIGKRLAAAAPGAKYPYSFTVAN